jgi:hypothetical protein
VSLDHDVVDVGLRVLAHLLAKSDAH